MQLYADVIRRPIGIVTESDLVIGDEAWDVDYYLHENPEIKRTAFAWMTDFVGWLPMPSGGAREEFVAAEGWPGGISVECIDTGHDTPTGGRLWRVRDELSDAISQKVEAGQSLEVAV
mgnify:CR=1 FL=1